ncbi:MAG: hypothetical protein O3B84_06665 [Chloroflexi bacterium]|nr:hypothetical protein [Chloroflexota bacterium]
MSDLALSSTRLEAANALDAIELYYAKGWTDGLPVVPPTPERVAETIAAAQLAPDDVIGAVPTRNREITAEKAAINAVMAGCLPEYFPVVVAALKAMCHEDYNLHGSTASTMGTAPLIVVNGPIRDRIGLNYGRNLFGPGVRAYATIGRAVRLVLMNVCGAIPGVLDMAVMGQAAKYTYCIAEDEHPNTSWTPHHVERGLEPGMSAVTVFPAVSQTQISASGASPEVVLTAVASTLLGLGPFGGEVVIVIPPENVRVITDAGWTKRNAREFLVERTKRSMSEWAAARFALPDPATADRVLSAVDDPDRIVLLGGGGTGGPYTAVIPIWGRWGSDAQGVTVPING